MNVKHINKTTFDVFFDNGWDNWARFQKNGSGVTQIDGVEVPKPIISFLNKRYSK